MTEPKKRGRPKGAKRSKTAPSAILANEKMAEALNYRKMGYTFSQIGEFLGCSHPNAHRLVVEGLRAALQEPADDLRRLELERVDHLMTAVAGDAFGGSLQAIDSFLKLMERRAKLLGIDAPDKHQHGGLDGNPIGITITPTDANL